MRAITLVACLALSAATSSAATTSAATPRAVALAAAALKYTAPAGWVTKTPSSSMRLAEWTLPKATTDSEDALATLYFFGANMGGNAQANIERWIGQFTQPDGKPSKDVAKTSQFMTTSGLKVVMVDVAGTYVAEVTPGSAEHFNKTGWRQFAALIDTPGGPHFVKVVGPAATLAQWESSVTAFVKSISYE